MGSDYNQSSMGSAGTGTGMGQTGAYDSTTTGGMGQTGTGMGQTSGMGMGGTTGGMGQTSSYETGTTGTMGATTGTGTINASEVCAVACTHCMLDTLASSRFKSVMLHHARNDCTSSVWCMCNALADMFACALI